MATTENIRKLVWKFRLLSICYPMLLRITTIKRLPVF